MAEESVEVPLELVEALSTTNQEIKRLSDAANTIKDLIKDMLGETEFGTCAGEPRIRWAHVRTRRLDMHELRARVDPAVLMECYVEDTTRRFIPLSAAKK